MGNVYGYHRTSTTEQHLDRGIKAINDYCQEHNIRTLDMRWHYGVTNTFIEPWNPCH
ncbi:MAG: hypothetical protein P4L59_18990 [Desulfosporosinus sp.]|nr:hypothetical protein [Desulfosporosinus sp.]